MYTQFPPDSGRCVIAKIKRRARRRDERNETARGEEGYRIYRLG